MAPPTQHVLRLRRTDSKTAKHMLINIAKTGRNWLDLELTGTDREDLFIAAFTEADTKAYQDRNFSGNFAEWKILLMFALLHHRPEGTLPELLQGVETVAAISVSKGSKVKKTVTITIRKNVDGITQRLGTIPLEQTDTEVDTLEWIDTAAAEADGLRSQLEELQTSVESQKDSIAKLTTELDMLVRAKKEHEEELLSKFAALLNAKKLKIRDQQRLLNGAKIDPAAAKEVSRARSAKTSRKAGSSRGGKRKANGASLSLSEDEDAADDDSATVDGSDEGASRRDQVTPEPEEQEELDAVEDEEVISSDSTPAAFKASHESVRGQSQRSSRRQQEAEPMDVDKPSRKIPSRAKEPTPPPDANTNDDDDETDDEL